MRVIGQLKQVPSSNEANWKVGNDLRAPQTRLELDLVKPLEIFIGGRVRIGLVLLGIIGLSILLCHVVIAVHSLASVQVRVDTDEPSIIGLRAVREVWPLTGSPPLRSPFILL